MENTLKRGCIPTPRHKLAAARPYIPTAPPVGKKAYVPFGYSKDSFGNNKYGDCVSADEAFVLSICGPKIVLDSSVVTAWAQQHGELNGADLLTVIQQMAARGFPYMSGAVGDGPSPATVDWTQESVLQSALDQRPLKLGIDANGLGSGAGSYEGWVAVGGGTWPNEDHCVELCGYGTFGWLREQFHWIEDIQVSDQTPGYAVYTWSTTGFVDHARLVSFTGECWDRGADPVWQGSGPAPWVTPTPPPPPPPPPSGNLLTLATALQPGQYQVSPARSLAAISPDVICALACLAVDLATAIFGATSPEVATLKMIKDAICPHAKSKRC